MEDFIIQDNELIDFTSQYTKIKGETTISDEDVGYQTEYNYWRLQSKEIVHDQVCCK